VAWGWAAGRGCTAGCPASGRGRRPRAPDRGAQQRGCARAGPPAPHRRGEGVAVRPVEHDGERDPASWLGQRHPVAAVHRVEGRDVELLGHVCPAVVIGPHQVAVPLVVGVVHLGDHALKRAVGPVAPVHGQRVEHVAEHARVGQHQHPAAGQVDAAARQEVIHVLPDAAARIAEMIRGAEPGSRAKPRQLVQVDQPLIGRVAEGVAQRGLPGVPDPALVDGRGGGLAGGRGGAAGGPGWLAGGRGGAGARYHWTPSEPAAATPDRQPSSWKPQPW